MPQKTSRRQFLKVSTLTGIAATLNTDSVLANDDIEDSADKLVFLFQGDSITDGNRGRNKDPNHIMGHGYAFSVASRVGADFADANHTFYNRGISGNRITDLKSRWQTDTLDLKPDILSILIGINDASGLINKAVVEAADIDSFEATYRSVLAQSKEQNQAIILVLCLPFVYPIAKIKDNWEKYNNTVKSLSERIKKLAAEFNAVIVDFTPAFDKAFRNAAKEYWIWDGVHPTVAGHELMAREWIKEVSARLKFLRKYKY